MHSNVDFIQTLDSLSFPKNPVENEGLEGNTTGGEE